MNGIEKRNSSVDIARLYALFCVISVHFFLYTGFYDIPCNGLKMYVATVIRCSFMVCIPLYLMITGYLMCENTVSKKYFLKIDKTLGIYVLASAVCLLMKKYFFDMRELNILSIFNYTASTYGWYVEMYLGLFLLIPFLNIIYRGLNGQKQKLVLIAVFITLSQLPSVINVYNFTVPGAIADPAVTDAVNQLIPGFWTKLYPISYYFIGAYLREYPIKIKRPTNILLYIVSVTVFGSFAFYKSGSGIFKSGTWQNWESFLLLPCGVLAFIFILNLKAEKLPVKLRIFLANIADVAFGAYLLSCIFDKLMYNLINQPGLSFFDKAKNYPGILITYMLSLLASYSVTTFYKLIRSYGDRIVAKLKAKKDEPVTV